MIRIAATFVSLDDSKDEAQIDGKRSLATVTPSLHGAIEAGRPLDALLAAYASGSVSPPLGVLIESHLELKPENRAFVDALEALGGQQLGAMAPVPIPDRDRRLAAILDG